MRRDDREITNINEIYDVLMRCTTINLGINDADSPYVVPMTFGCSMDDQKITVYFHCAGMGKKWDLLHQNNNVCVEAHIYERIVMAGTENITAQFESVIGWGKAVLVEDQKAKVDAIKIMLEHYDSSGFPATSCSGLSRVQVYRIELEKVSGKRNK